MNHLPFAFELKALDDSGEFEGYASTYDHKDQGGDIVLKGAFAAALRTRGAKGIKMLADHDSTKRVGVWTDIAEDDTGLRVKGRLLTEKSIGKEAYIDLKAGALSGLSIGGRTKSDSYDGRKRARLIKEFDLFEISLVTFPMNEQAQVNSVKELSPDVLKAIEADLKADPVLKMSNAAAVSAVAIVKRHLREGGGVNQADASREADAQALADLVRRNIATLTR